MAIGRISGPLLAKNLLRDGIDLAVETDLLYLDVTNGRIGIRKNNPSYELDVNGTISAKKLKVTYTDPGTGTAELGKLFISSGTISTTVGPITIQPSGNDRINLIGDTTVTGNFHATGNITADGDIILGNSPNDSVIFDAEVASNIIPDADKVYSLGSTERNWLDIYADKLVTNKINSVGNISITPGAGLLEINGEINAKGRNPIGTAPVVTNVLYVTMDGNDTNDGRAEDASRACRTISGAAKSPYYRPGTLIRVSSGKYLENNPILMQPNTSIIGTDLRTTSIEPINKTQDLFHLQSGCYLAQMQFLNGRSGLLPVSYVSGRSRGAYATAFPPQVNGSKIDVYHSPYIQNCTNQTGPWLIDGTLFVPNQTVQVPAAVGTTTFPANTTTVVVTLTTGTISSGLSIISGPQTPGFFNARTLLLANKEFIKDQVVVYVANTFPTFEFEREKYARDVGVVIENIAYDATFGGNEKSVETGLSYYSGVINLAEGQQVQTTTAINYINTLTQFIIRNQVAPNISSNTVQVINTALIGGEIAAEELETGINIITNIINNGIDAAPAVFKSCGPETPYVSAEILLQANRTFLQEEVTAYVDETYLNFEYNKDSCYRDVGLIIDAVSQDIVVGGNTKTLEAALSYYIGSTGVSSIAASYVEDNIKLLRTIILAGPTSAPVPVVGPNLGVGFSNANDLLIRNKNFIRSEVSAYIQSLFNGGYELTQSQQDSWNVSIGIMLDAIAEDTAAGGNANTVSTGLIFHTTLASLFSGAQLETTVNSLNYMATLCSNIVKNIQNINLYQVVYSQVIVPAYMGLASAIPREENITVDAINYLKYLSNDIISNTEIVITRSNIPQVINTFFDKGEYAETVVNKNYDIISSVILNGPAAAPLAYAGSGFFATTGISSNDVRESPKIIAITTQTGNIYTIRLSNSTVGAVSNGTLYFGETSVFPMQDSEVESLGFQYTGNTSTWNSRKVDSIGGMGGSLVDGAVVSDRSPIQSFVYDAYTQINQGGRGIHITNNGYAQLVSVFTVFCSIGVQVDNGGIASIVNSNSNFGDICLFASGYGKREFSGTVYNPAFPTYQPNGEYYPFGYWPKNGLIEIYIPDTANRPHISLVMEVEPPITYYDFEGNVVSYTNQQGFPGFLNAQPSLGVLTTGSIVITGIDTSGIAVGNSLYIRDQLGNEGYASTGTVVTDVGYQSVTLNKGLLRGGQDPIVESNPDFFNLYFCGNSYYTVLSSEINDSFGRTIGDRLIPSNQLAPEINSLEFIKTQLNNLYATAGVNAASTTFVNSRIDIMIDIISSATLAAAESVVPQNSRIKKSTSPAGASLAIEVITNNVESIVDDTITHIDLTFNNYDHEKCKRDIRLILKQLTYDLEFGGNYYSVYSGLSYWVRSGTHHIVNLEEAVNNTALFPDGSTVNFYQRSYMSASGYVFEYVGAGTNYGALPQRGIKDPIQGKEVVQVNNGKVFFTSTDQNGDFRIGPGLVVSQSTGVLSGRTFTKSLFANLTPFILAIESGG